VVSRGRAEKDGAVEPTPETLAKLRPDPVLWLVENYPHLFRVEHEMAAKEIERCVSLLAGQVMARAQDMSRIGRSHPREYTGREVAMLCDYANWQDELRVRHIPFWPVYEIAVEGYRPHELIAKAPFMKILFWLEDSLSRYCRIRGWIK
jgi:hypothetical protein